MKKNDHRKPRNAAAVNRSFKVSKNPRETHGREMKQRGFSQVEPVEEAWNAWAPRGFWWFGPSPSFFSEPEGRSRVF